MPKGTVHNLTREMSQDSLGYSIKSLKNGKGSKNNDKFIIIKKNDLLTNEIFNYKLQ